MSYHQLTEFLPQLYNALPTFNGGNSELLSLRVNGLCIHERKTRKVNLPHR